MDGETTSNRMAESASVKRWANAYTLQNVQLSGLRSGTSYSVYCATEALIVSDKLDVSTGSLLPPVQTVEGVERPTAPFQVMFTDEVGYRHVRCVTVHATHKPTPEQVMRGLDDEGKPAVAAPAAMYAQPGTRLFFLMVGAQPETWYDVYCATYKNAMTPRLRLFTKPNKVCAPVCVSVCGCV